MKWSDSDDNDSVCSMQGPPEDDSKDDSEESYKISELTPLSTSPAWDEINASLNIRVTGSDSLMGLCNEALFARSHLKGTMSALLKGPTQARAALFCAKEIQSKDITEDLQFAFAKLLPHSLLHAEQLPELTTAIRRLGTQHFIYLRLPVETQKAITGYLASTSGTDQSLSPTTIPMVHHQQLSSLSSKTGTNPGPSQRDNSSESPSTSSHASVTPQQNRPPNSSPSSKRFINTTQETIEKLARRVADSLAERLPAKKARKRRTCVKCAELLCPGSQTVKNCKSPCRDCGERSCRGRNSKKPSTLCHLAWI